MDFFLVCVGIISLVVAPLLTGPAHSCQPSNHSTELHYTCGIVNRETSCLGVATLKFKRQQVVVEQYSIWLVDLQDHAAHMELFRTAAHDAPGGGNGMDGFEKLLVVRGLRLVRLARVLRMVGRFKARKSTASEVLKHADPVENIAWLALLGH